MGRHNGKWSDERLATKDDLERLELRLTLKLGTLSAAAIGIMAALSRLLG